MRLIFSRKGFDSAAGGIPSPIFPDGTLASLPIPLKPSPYRYRDLSAPNGAGLGELVRDLTRRRIDPDWAVHLDPDLFQEALPRTSNWRAALGQAGAAQSHLRSQGVTAGDIFVFFGWFREVRRTPAGWRFVARAPDRHVIFGWLQVGEVLAPHELNDSPSAELRGHVHALHQFDRNDALYAAARTLSIDSSDTGVPGAGVMREWRDELCLTAPGKTRSHWRVPAWMKPSGERRPLSYHASPACWTEDDGGCTLSTVGRGQEFVLHMEDYPESFGWLAGLLGGARG